MSGRKMGFGNEARFFIMNQLKDNLLNLQFGQIYKQY